MELNTLELGTQNWSWSVTTTIGGTRIDFSAVFAFARELELAKYRPLRYSKEIALIKRRIAVAKSKRAVHGGEKVCV